MEAEAGMGSNMPDMLASISPNRGSDTPASAEVKRTGLQPQVGAQEIHTKQKDRQDKIQAIDSAVQHFDKDLPGNEDGDEDSKINKFKKLWGDLKQKWEDLKMDQDDEGDDSGGLGDDNGDEKYTSTMRQNPNMVPAPQQMPAGPGVFGAS